MKNTVIGSLWISNQPIKIRFGNDLRILKTGITGKINGLVKHKGHIIEVWIQMHPTNILAPTKVFLPSNFLSYFDPVSTL